MNTRKRYHHVDLCVFFSRKVPAGCVHGHFRLYCLLEGVDGLGKQGLFVYYILALDKKAKGVCQLSWYWTHFLLTKRMWMSDSHKCSLVAQWEKSQTGV